MLPSTIRHSRMPRYWRVPTVVMLSDEPLRLGSLQKSDAETFVRRMRMVGLISEETDVTDETDDELAAELVVVL
jgi:hypothetical protein